MRVVLDPNVIISAALSLEDAPGRLFRHWLDGAYDLIISPMLLDELERALGYSKLADRISTHERSELLELLTRAGVITQDPQSPADIQSLDPDDDYLIALASFARAILISADQDLLRLSDQIPVYSPAELVTLIEAST